MISYTGTIRGWQPLSRVLKTCTGTQTAQLRGRLCGAPHPSLPLFIGDTRGPKRVREEGGWSREVGKGAAKLRRLSPPAMPRAMASIAVHLVVFFYENMREDGQMHGERLRGARHRGGGEPAKFGCTLSHLTRPAPASRTLLGPPHTPYKKGK